MKNAVFADWGAGWRLLNAGHRRVREEWEQRQALAAGAQHGSVNRGRALRHPCGKRLQLLTASDGIVIPDHIPGAGQ
jgi:hypothetical protein